MKNKIFVLSFFLLFALSASAQLIQIEEVAKKLNVPAIQLVHVKNGKAKSFVYGKKKVDSSAMITEKTVFQSASLTKVITAYTFFKLYDKGLIALDVPLTNYYSYNRLATTVQANLITARMVLTHRTGFLNWEGAVGTDSWRNSALHLQFEPGSQYRYSGEGFYYLQLVMEHITGKSLAQLVKEELLIPLGITNSYMKWNANLFNDFAYGHTAQLKARNLRKYEYVNAAYTFYTCALDYTKFVQKALILGEGLKKETHRLMISKAGEVQRIAGQVNPIDNYVPSALGLRLQLNEKGTWLWHTGSNPGFRCFFIANPKTKESLVAFSNSDTAMPVFKEMMHLFLAKEQKFWAWEWREGELD